VAFTCPLDAAACAWLRYADSGSRPTGRSVGPGPGCVGLAMIDALTLVLPHYKNLGMLAEQQRIWADYPCHLRRRLHVIVVDDGSPKGMRPSAKSIRKDLGLASLRLYRTLKDVRWNWLFCRNLGMDQATTDWVLLTDIDHVVPMELLVRLLATDPIDNTAVYQFARVDAPHVWPYQLSDCTPYKPHRDTWLMTRTMFDAVGGYDERFSGFYGTSSEFRERVNSTAARVITWSEPLVRYPREIIADASTTTYGRKEEQDRVNVTRIRSERDQIPDWRPLRLTFPWERLL